MQPEKKEFIDSIVYTSFIWVPLTSDNHVVHLLYWKPSTDTNKNLQIPLQPQAEPYENSNVIMKLDFDFTELQFEIDYI